MLSQSKYDYADSFAGTFTDSNQKTKAAAVGKAFFTSGPKWIEKLFALRNAIVRFFGLKTLTISTTVQFNNHFGKLYFLLVRPFHRLIVPAMLKGIIRQIETKSLSR